MSFKQTLITAALPYTNGPVHIGHLAGVYIPADIYARYLRLKGKKVLFVCGSDEHGVPIMLKARAEGVNPQDIVDKYHAIIKNSFEEFGISFDIYSRTSNAIHHETAQGLFTNLYNKGLLEEKESEQFFDPIAQQFLADRYITGTCPKCGNDRAYGDQCENCGSTLAATDLINPASALSGATPILKKTTHWYLPLNQYQERLEKWILNEHDNWKPNVYGQCKSWLKSGDGLQARAITRDLSWGVDVPLKDAEGKKLYVWFDAPIGYISATREWAIAHNEDWKQWWKNEQTQLLHFIGKDNIVFHCIIFPAMLMAHGDYILPDNVPANEFLNLENNKISTSRNWAVWLNEYLTDFPGKQDELRYTLTSIIPETKDSDFTWKDYQLKVNSELVAILGNFINRVMVLTHKYSEGIVPAATEPLPTTPERINMLTAYNAHFAEAGNCIAKMIAYLDDYKFRDAQGEMMNLARISNKFLAETEPWKLVKTDQEAVNAILSYCLEVSANLAIAVEPFLPLTAGKIAQLLNISITQEKKKELWQGKSLIEVMQPGAKINEAQLLFQNIDDEAIATQVDKLQQSKATTTLEASQKQSTEPLKPEFTFDEFIKADMRVGTILEAEKVPKSDKLLKFLIDTGIDKRTIVSGIAQHYNPMNLIGQQVVLLVNLPTRKLRGVESQGMILTAENPDGSLSLLKPQSPALNGAAIK